MNIYNKIKIVSLSLGVLLFTACDSYLNLKPTDSIDDSKAFETIEDLELGIKGVYAMIGNEGMISLSSRASDDLRLSADNRGFGVQIHNWSYNSSTGEFGSIMSIMYHAIDRANRLLEVCNKFDADDELVKQIKGEALFVRAYCHFELVKCFCKAYAANDALGIPYMLESVISEPARESQGAVYTKILADIESSMTFLQGHNVDYSRATENALLALKTKVQLYKRDWNGLIATATQVIDNSGMRLAEYDEVADLWNDAAAEDVEVMFYLKRINSGAGSIFTDNNGDIYFHPAVDLMNQYTNDDIRHLTYFGIDSKNDDVVTKHDGREGGETNVVHYKALRLSDIYLMRAEAYAEKEMLTEAEADVNAIRVRRIVNPAILSFGSKESALKSIQEERRRELAYEGNRFFDLKRWGLGINRIDEDAVLVSNRDLEAGDYRFVFPIPQAEIFANSNMVQNSGYSND
jgi:hypothetical protein